MVLAKVGEIIYMHFTVFDTDGITPLTGQAGACTSSLRRNGANAGEAVTIAEIGTTGRYYATFTPISLADYDLEVTCPDDRVMGESWQTEINDLDDIASKVDDVDARITTVMSALTVIRTETDKIEAILDIEHGRWFINEDLNRQFFYDEENSNTIVAVFDLLDVDGNPAYTNVFERVPVAFQNTLDMGAEFVVTQGSEDLEAEFEVG